MLQNNDELRAAYPQIGALLDELLTQMQAVLGDKLVGVYLYGSLVVGDFYDAISDVDLQGLVDSDWVAFTFAEKNRRLLGIPLDAQFQVLPRIVVTKRFEQPGESLDRAAAAKEDTAGDAAPEPAVGPLKELLFKVRWSHTEPNPRDIGGVATRRIQTGVTLVIDWDQRLIRSLLGPLDLAGRRTARDAMLRRLVGRGLAQITTPDDPDSVQQTLGTGVEAVVTDGILRVRNTGRLLHVAKDAADA